MFIVNPEKKATVHSKNGVFGPGKEVSPEKLDIDKKAFESLIKDGIVVEKKKGPGRPPKQERHQTEESSE
jgi:hypothetical protein